MAVDTWPAARFSMKILMGAINEGSGYFFHGKMPGCCLPGLTAATALHFTASY
jgi:hypothetical protein